MIGGLMTAFIFGDKIIYTCGKNAGSTIRSWVCDMIIMSKEDNRQIPSGNRMATNTPIPKPLVEQIQIREMISKAEITDIAGRLGLQYHFGFEGTVEGLTPYCIHRDPIERLDSCLSQKLHQPAFVSTVGSLDNVIENFDEIVIKPLQEHRTTFSFNNKLSTWRDLIVPRHLAPQTYTYGSDPSKFERVFDMSDVSTEVLALLEDFFGRPLPVRHKNKRQRGSVISDDLFPAIKKLYELDYEAGWGRL
jgi:hypothetical protein